MVIVKSEQNQECSQMSRSVRPFDDDSHCERLIIFFYGKDEQKKWGSS